jgi:hypothetical protein
MVTIQISLPGNLANDANELGLLESSVLAELIRKEIKRVRVEELFAAADKMAALGGGAMTPEDVEREIRLERAAQHAARS